MRVTCGPTASINNSEEQAGNAIALEKTEFYLGRHKDSSSPTDPQNEMGIHDICKFTSSVSAFRLVMQFNLPKSDPNGETNYLDLT